LWPSSIHQRRVSCKIKKGNKLVSEKIKGIIAIIVELKEKVTENAKRGHIYLQVYTVSEKKKLIWGNKTFYIELLQKTETLLNNNFSS